MIFPELKKGPPYVPIQPITRAFHIKPHMVLLALCQGVSGDGHARLFLLLMMQHQTAMLRGLKTTVCICLQGL